MKTNLAYIDDVMERAIAAEAVAPTIPQADKDAATKRGRKIIGGFRVHDGAAEARALDEIIWKRKAAIEKFRTDRAAIRDQLSKLGVTPLAICPTGAWYKICRDAKLYILSPNAEGQVFISRGAFNGYAENSIDRQASKNWTDFLDHLFPDGRSLNDGHRATLILPDPPEDVADILCKAQSLTLIVAAVGEAIRFAEKPSELMKSSAHPKDAWAREQGYEDYQDWLKRDPIVFAEHESATAIIAQFGEFPIEQDVVDAAIKADTLLTDKPSSTEYLLAFSAVSTGGMIEAYYRHMQSLIADQHRNALDEATRRGWFSGMLTTT